MMSMPGDEGKTGFAAHPAVRENGLVVPSDISKERLVVPGGGSVTLGKAIPKREELRQKVQGLSAKAALATVMQADIDSGEFLAVWEKKKAMAKGGDFRAIEAYLDRFLGKSTQAVALSAEVRVSLSDEDREALSAIKQAFGMGVKRVVNEAGG
jgi:hypothetical protein